MGNTTIAATTTCHLPPNEFGVTGSFVPTALVANPRQNAVGMAAIVAIDFNLWQGMALVASPRQNAVGMNAVVAIDFNLW